LKLPAEFVNLFSITHHVLIQIIEKGLIEMLNGKRWSKQKKFKI